MKKREREKEGERRTRKRGGSHT
jgi:hypothetical protein